MYVAGHLLASIAFAKIAHKPLGVKFFPLAVAAMAVNLIDADHLIYYYLDDGTKSSFALHFLHQSWAFLGLAVCLLALVLKPWQNLIFGIFFALMLHYGLDLLANVFVYDLNAVIGFEILCLALLAFLFRNDEQRLKYYLFFVGLWLFVNLVLGFITFILGWKPDAHRGVYLTATLLTLLGTLAFWKLFKPKHEQSDVS
ncbi:MAG: hypothetical protein FWC94_03775 [Bacteroidales bacterium]|nr:hypothetical protein [Bacteroidales bacterium]